MLIWCPGGGSCGFLIGDKGGSSPDFRFVVSSSQAAGPSVPLAQRAAAAVEFPFCLSSQCFLLPGAAAMNNFGWPKSKPAKLVIQAQIRATLGSLRTWDRADVDTGQNLSRGPAISLALASVSPWRFDAHHSHVLPFVTGRRRGVFPRLTLRVPQGAAVEGERGRGGNAAPTRVQRKVESESKSKSGRGRR